MAAQAKTWDWTLQNLRVRRQERFAEKNHDWIGLRWNRAGREVVIHLSPPPSPSHQDIEERLLDTLLFLKKHIRQHLRAGRDVEVALRGVSPLPLPIAPPGSGTGS